MDSNSKGSNSKQQIKSKSLLGKYELGRLLGRGTFAKVYLARPVAGGEPVAVKVIDKAQVLGTAGMAPRVLREVTAMRRLCHPNVLRLHEVLATRARIYLVMELAPGGELLSRLAALPQRRLPERAARRVFAQLVDALAYCHARGVAHRDVKPQNVLLDAALLPKLADFGMAKFVGRDFSRVLTTMRGTKGYLAPEWIGGAAVTPKVDVYSYGMVLLELVSGRRNSDEGYTASDGERVVYFPMRAARELRKGDVSTLLDDRLCGDANLEEVERACKVACWCIQDDEADRPTMGEVVQMLEGLLHRDMPPLPRLLETIFGTPQSLMIP
jgi:carbon catabolite-derepressing protein kinase